MRILATLLATLTQAPRQQVVAGVDFKWSKKSWTHNLFRVYELVFWRRAGVRIESASMPDGKGGTITFVYSWEAAVAQLEGFFRSLFKLPDLSKIRIWMPVAAPIGGMRMPSQYLFAIAFDTSVLSAETNNAGQSWSHTNTGSNLILTVGDTLESTTSDQYSNMTYNSVAMTVGNSKASTARFGKMWYLTGPATGAHTVQPTNTSQFNQGASISFSGAKQSAIDNTATASGTSSSPAFSITPVAAGNTCWTVNFIFAEGGTPTGSTGTTRRQVGGAPCAIGDSNGTVSSAGYTMNWTLGGSFAWGGIIMSIAQATAVTTNPAFLLNFI